MLLCGDFHFPSADWPTLSSPSQDTQIFIDLTLDFGFVQIIDEPTCLDNILDPCLAPDPKIVTSVSFIDGFSANSHERVTLASNKVYF